MRFLDEYMPAEVPGYPCVAAPRTSTSIAETAGGNEQANQNWEHPRRRFVLPEAAGRDWTVIQALMDFWLILRGPFRTFPWRDPLDKASIPLRVPNEPDEEVLERISGGDQLIGTGDGFTDAFQLTKTYVVGGESYVRRLHLPVTTAVLVEIDGKAHDDPTHAGGAYSFTVSRPGGVVTFDRPVAAGLSVRAGFLFDCEVRFESDEAFEGILRTYQVGGFADITLIEVRPC